MKELEMSAAALWRRRSTFALTALAGALMLFVLTLALPRSYEATAVIFVDPSERGTREQINTSQGDLLSRTYRSLAENPNVADRVLPELDIEMTRTALLAKMDFEAISDTPLVEITASDSNPATAASIANTYTRVFAGRIGDRFAAGEVPSRVAITEPAVPPTEASGAWFTPLLILGSILVLALATLAALVRDRLARGIEVGAEADMFMDEPILARIPIATSGGHGVDDAMPAELADSLRSLRTGIELNPVDRRTLMVTSRGEREGKTTLATFMALAAASDGDRVALIECDLRNPGLSATSLGARLSGQRPGLAAFLAGRSRIDDIIQKDPALPWLNVVMAGDVPKDAGHLLRSPRLGDLIAYLREHNDWVIVDTPSITAGDDTMLLVPHTDASIFVIDSVLTKPGAAMGGLNRLRRAGSEVLGVAVNRVEPSEPVSFEQPGPPAPPELDELLEIHQDGNGSGGADDGHGDGPPEPGGRRRRHPADRLLRRSG